MLKTTTIILFIMQFSSMCYSQKISYYKYKEQKIYADSGKTFLEKDDFVNSSKMFTKAMSYGKLGDFDLYYAGIAYALNGESNKSFNTLNKLSTKYLVYCNHDSTQYCILNDMKNEPALDTLRKFPERWAKTLKLLTLKGNEGYKKLNKEPLDSLKKMEILDQKYRLYQVQNWEKLPKNVNDSLSALQNAIDKENFRKLKLIIEKYGWPGYTLTSTHSEIIIMHLVSDFDFYLPIIKKAAAKGEIGWDIYDHVYKNQMSSQEPTFSPIILEDVVFKKGESELLPSTIFQLGLIYNHLFYWRTTKRTIEIDVYYSGNLNKENAQKISELRTQKISDFFINKGISKEAIQYKTFYCKDKNFFKKKDCNVTLKVLMNH